MSESEKTQDAPKLPLRRHRTREQKQETTLGIFLRRTTENPFILPAMGLCLYSMYRMTRSLFMKDSRAFTQSGRMRVGAQALTISIAAGGVYYEAEKKKSRALQARASPNSEPQPPNSTHSSPSK
ncbi:hypothetical protein BJ742DRAFT_788742 [Cladochytrium replicatum]|nr:hypothetical protein BJ742DRAFT_788742 [Cladochytrium replicatum]